MRGSARLAILAVVAAGTGVFAGSSPAASVTTTGTITGSMLSVTTSATPSFSASLDLGDATPTYSVAMTTQDTRGTGAGWNETITSTQFTTGSPADYTLPASASTVTGVTASNGTGANSPPANTISYPVTIPAGTSPPAAVKVFDSASNNGMGRFTITPSISVFVPQNSYGGTYTSILTLALGSGP